MIEIERVVLYVSDDVLSQSASLEQNDAIIERLQLLALHAQLTVRGFALPT